MHCCCTGRQCHYLLVEGWGVVAMVDKLFEVLLETVDVRTKRHDPVLVERLFDEVHLTARHMRQAQ